MKKFFDLITRDWLETAGVVAMFFLCLMLLLMSIDTCKVAINARSDVCRDSVVLVNVHAGRVSCDLDQKMTVRSHEESADIFVTCECVRPEDAGADR